MSSSHNDPVPGARYLGAVQVAWRIGIARPGSTCSVSKRAVRDRIITFKPCENTELPKVVTERVRTLTPVEYRRLLDAMPDQHRLMIQTAIETGLLPPAPRHHDGRWGSR